MKYMRAELLFFVLRFVWISLFKDTSGSCLGLRAITTRAHHHYLMLEREYFSILRSRNSNRGERAEQATHAGDAIMF